MVKITSCLVFQFVVAELAAEMNKFIKFTSGSLWKPLYVLIPKLGAGFLPISAAVLGLEMFDLMKDAFLRVRKGCFGSS
jgi:hypothetical protein